MCSLETGFDNNRKYSSGSNECIMKFDTFDENLFNFSKYFLFHCMKLITSLAYTLMNIKLLVYQYLKYADIKNVLLINSS